MNLKKLRMPIVMAVVGVAALVFVSLNMFATAPTTIKSITLSDQGGIWLKEGVKANDKITLPTGLALVVVKVATTDPKAVVTTTGETGFKDGDNILDIKVTGSDAKSSTHYKITLVQPKLAGWCQTNKAKIAATNDNYELADIYQDYSLIYIEPGATEAEVRANITCFSENLQKYIASH